MKYIILMLISFVFVAVAFAASGDKTPAFTPKFHNISSSTKASKAAGELRYDASYLFINISTAARPHWRRVGLGAGF